MHIAAAMKNAVSTGSTSSSCLRIAAISAGSRMDGSVAPFLTCRTHCPADTLLTTFRYLGEYAVILQRKLMDFSALLRNHKVI